MLLATVLSAWLQYAPAGLQARAVVTGSCPAATIDGRGSVMTQRSGAADGFPNLVCSADLPAGTRAAAVENHALPVPARGSAPRTIVVLGDTGCRLKGAIEQGCNDPAAWPFPAVARAVAAVHPDLIVHVGDYYYRETPCAGGAACAGSPSGDNAAAWDADWFAPAAPMFAAAPLVLARGNHEDCARGGAGWLRYLDPYASTACAGVTEPYAVTLPGLSIVVFDSATADDVRADPALVSAYRYGFAAARALARGESWLVTHRPPYTNATQRAAMGTSLQAFEAVLAGHVHTFSAINVAGQPPLVINGEGGDLLDTGEAPFLVAALGELSPTAPPATSTRFGFGVYTRNGRGWSISLRDPGGIERMRCALADGAVRC